MSVIRVRSRWWLAALAAAVAAVMTPVLVNVTAGAAPAAVTLPPPGAPFDYQIGGGYDLPDGVRVVSRDREDEPAEPTGDGDVYNICYVNAFQTQPGEEGDWEQDLLLRDEDGELVEDPEWEGEYALDIRTAENRAAIAAKVNEWIDGCAAAGYDAVEPDNLDTYTRWGGLIEEEHTLAFIRLLTDHAHGLGLAVAQKNTSELSGKRDLTGLDFVVAEQCGEQSNCDEYTAGYGDNVIAIEYTEEGLKNACEGYGDRLSIVQRDEYVVTPDEEGYLRETCPAGD